MSEMSTQGATSGEGTSGEAAPTPASGESVTVTPAADAFAAERARLEAERAEWQGKYDRLYAETQKAAQPAPTPAAPTGDFLTKESFREELRRQRELDAAVASLRQEFPSATDVFDRVEQFDSVEQLRVAAQNSHQRFTEQMTPHVTAAVEAALKPYVDKFGPLQSAPAGATPGEGGGLPTWEEVNRMSIDELDALDKAHPGLYDRLFAEHALRS